MNTGSERTVDEELEFLVEKAAVLEAIDGGARELAELTRATAYSRATVTRTVNAFDEAGLIETRRVGGKHTYRLTGLGTQALAWLADGRALVRYRPLFEALPADLSVPYWMFTEGRVDLAAEFDVAKHEVFDQILEFISRGDRFHVVAPNLTRDETFHHLADEVLEDGLAVEMVLPESFFETLLDRFPDELAAMFREGDVAGYVLPGDDLHYGFGLTYRAGEAEPHEMALVGYDEHFHNAAGTVVHDAPEAVAWAETQFADVKARARAVENTDYGRSLGRS